MLYSQDGSFASRIVNHATHYPQFDSPSSSQFEAVPVRTALHRACE